MCRAEGVPVRVIYGKTNGGFGNNWSGHSWNEVFINGKWTTIDCTFAATAYEPLSDGGAGKPKDQLQWILNPNTDCVSQYQGNTSNWGNLDYFGNTAYFNQSHKQVDLQTQGFFALPQNTSRKDKGFM